MLARISHPVVLKVLDIGVEEEHPYLVTDLLSAGTLHQRLQAVGRLPPAEVVPLFVELLEGLEACHQAGVAHRDIKPENIRFGEDGRARLADLGVAAPR